MTDLSAVLGRGQLAQLQTFNARRTQLALQYREKLKPLNGIEPLHLPTHDHLHAWHLFIVRVEKRDAFMALLKEKQIGTGLHFRAVHLQKYYAETFKLQPGFLPHTEWNSNHICSLPLFPAMSDSDQDQVVDAIRETLQELSE
jgi:UDP-4-amino-4-deoxy-L-arabinose-oxoglutarate aminotransferase